MRRHQSSRKKHSGTVLLTSLVMIIMLCTLAAAMVDLGYIHACRSRMQSAADAAALAAAMRIGNVNSQEAQDDAKAWSIGFANYNLPGRGDVLVVDDVTFGSWDPSSKTFAAGGDSPNAVQAIVRRDGDNSITTFFSNIFGAREIGVAVTATAMISATSSAEGVPMALPGPGFGSIDPGNPDLDGPSSPVDGESFEVGDQVIVATFGDDDGKVPSLHVTLNIDADGAGAAESDVIDILNGTSDPVEMQVGDEALVLNAGTGDDGFADALEDRLDLPQGDPGREIVMAVVETLTDSRDIDGNLTGNVRVADFVSVQLDQIVEVEIPDPDDPDETITVRHLMGIVKNRRAETSWGGATPDGSGGGSVTVAELVQ